MEDSKFKYPEEYDDVKIPGYPVGSDITVMNVYYQRMEKDEETNKWKDDSITIIFKDNKTGERFRTSLRLPSKRAEANIFLSLRCMFMSN